MCETRNGEHRPIQTSAVIVLNATNRPITRPPSPPTPTTIPADNTISYKEPLEAFQLAGEHSQYRQKTQYAQSQSATRTAQCAPPSEGDATKERRLRGGLHVMNAEALALANLAQLYQTDAVARNGFHKAVEVIIRQSAVGSKLVVIGVGKSGLIAKKLVATFQSLAVRAVFLHPTEALHGDLGIVGPDDTLMFITYSGSTQELLAVLPHLDQSLPTILMTSHTRPDSCEFLKRRPSTILVPAPVHEPESTSFGVSAPTTSTTVALALGDALAMTAAHEMHPNVASAFAKNHPGGAIGVAAAAVPPKRHVLHPPQAVNLRQISIPWGDIYDASHLECGNGTAAGLLRAGYASKNGWVRVGEDVAAPSQLRSLCDNDLLKPLSQLRRERRERRGEGEEALLVSCHDMLAMSAETTVRQARDILRGTRGNSGSGADLEEDGDSVAAATSSVIAVTENGLIRGVLEVAHVLEHDE